MCGLSWNVCQQVRDSWFCAIWITVRCSITAAAWSGTAVSLPGLLGVGSERRPGPPYPAPSRVVYK